MQNATGDLYIKNYADDKDIIFQSDDGSGGVETYFFLDGSFGSSPYTIFPDSSTLALGTGGDLRLYHDSSHSYIKSNGTGNIYIMQQNNDVNKKKISVVSFGSLTINMLSIMFKFKSTNITGCVGCVSIVLTITA